MKFFYNVSTLVLFLILSGGLYGHCQVPCGIYDDAVRIVQIEEDIATMRKAMSMIKGLSGKSDAQSLTEFSVSYFDEHGMDHLKQVQNKK